MNSQKNTDYQIPKDFNSSEIMEPINNFPYASKIINENTIIKESVGSLITFNILSPEIKPELKYQSDIINLKKVITFKDKNPEDYNNVEKESLEKILAFLNSKNNELLDNKELSILFLDFIYKNEDLEIGQNELPLLYNYFIENGTLEGFDIEEKGNNEPKEQSKMGKVKEDNLFQQAIDYLNVLRPNNENNSKLANFLSIYAKEKNLNGENFGKILKDYMDKKVLPPIKIFLNSILDNLGEELSNKFYSFLEKKGYFGVIEDKILEKEFNNFVDSLIKKYEEDSFGKTIIKKKLEK